MRNYCDSVFLNKSFLHFYSFGVRCRAFIYTFVTFLSHLFPLPRGAGSAVPREGFDSSVIMPFSWCVVAVALPV